MRNVVIGMYNPVLSAVSVRCEKPPWLRSTAKAKVVIQTTPAFG